MKLPIYLFTYISDLVQEILLELKGKEKIR